MRVLEIWRYPVKSLAGERLDVCWIEKDGIPGDRGWAVVDEERQEATGGKRVHELMLAKARYVSEPGEGPLPEAEIDLPDGSRFRTRAPDAAARLTKWLGRPASLLSAPGKLFDARPIHVLTTASLAALALPPEGKDARRFRPNLLVDAPGLGFVEQAWKGKKLLVGKAILSVEKPTKRCVMTTLPQPGLGASPETLKTLARETGAALGVYATLLKAGEVRVGDRVELV